MDVQNRRFRAHSFAGTLNPDQRTQLFTWLLKFSLDEVLVKVAAPAPVGFDRKIHRTTLQRLRNLVENTDLTNFIGDAMDSACDVLDAECAAHTAPMRETLSLLLYSRALNSSRTASELDLNRLISASAKIEKLKPTHSAGVNPRFEDAATQQREATIVQSVSATPEPVLELPPALELQSAPAQNDQESSATQPSVSESPAVSPAPLEPRTAADLDLTIHLRPESILTDECAAGEFASTGESSRTAASAEIPSFTASSASSALIPNRARI